MTRPQVLMARAIFPEAVAKLRVQQQTIRERLMKLRIRLLLKRKNKLLLIMIG